MTVKTLPGDVEKIDKIQSMVEGYVEVDRMIEKLTDLLTPQDVCRPMGHLSHAESKPLLCQRIKRIGSSGAEPGHRQPAC